MISFYPGPSKVHSFLIDDMVEAFNKGILGINHRSNTFVEISKRCIDLMRLKLEIPQDYPVLFASSATECWEIITQSAIVDHSLHLYNGAFGEKWFDYTFKLRPTTKKISFDLEDFLEVNNFISQPDLIAIVQNETSNATQVSNELIKKLSAENPKSLIAVDATSSVGGVYLDFSNADIWFASVQKCFGLPAGLGVMICSPRAKNRVQEIGENSHYNSLVQMFEKMESFQTTHTPNILGIYLLMKVFERIPSIQETSLETTQKAKQWYQFLEFHGYKPLIKNDLVRSDTVIAVSSENIEEIKAKTLDKNIIIGNGYGNWAKTTFRIANFPAHTTDDIKKLMDVLKKN